MKTVAQIKEELKQARQKEKEVLEKRNKQIENYENLKNTTVLELCKKALEMSEKIKTFKENSFSEMNAMFEVLCEYSQRHADGKGSFRLTFGNYRVNYKKQGRVTFDERSIMAESYIKEFVTEKFKEDKDTHDLIISLLERKSKGEFDINLIQKLYKMEDRFDDESWKKGIQLLKQSYSYEHSKDYIVFEEKNNAGEWKQIPLNFANI